MRQTKSPFNSLALWVALAATLSCKARPTENQTGKAKSIGSPLEFCVALRGNGHYISTHFGGIARLLEDYGHIDALAGGSSSTITMFLYESIRMNPTIQAASDEERPLKMALLFKTLIGYLETLKDSPEIASVILAVNLLKDPNVQTAASLPESKWREAAAGLANIFSESRFISIINPNIIAMLEDVESLPGSEDSMPLPPRKYKNHEYKVREVMRAVREFGKFSATDETILFREGLLNFAWVAGAVGYIGDFYAGRLPGAQAELSRMLDQCGTKEVSVGNTWPDITQRKSECRRDFLAAVSKFREEWNSVPGRNSSRIQEKLSAVIPVMVSTGIIEGREAVRKFKDAESNYLQGKTPNLTLDFQKDVKFGYWLPYGFAGPITTRLMADPTSKFLNLGTSAVWDHVMRRSPAEPGLSSYVPINNERLSVGGWSDLFPVQALKAAGCERVVYLTRRTEESTFIVGNRPIAKGVAKQGISELLGLQEAERVSLYDLNNPTSKFSNALQQSDAVLCTDWNQCEDFETAQMMTEAYFSDLVTKDQLFKTKGKNLGHQVSQIVGCSDPNQAMQVLMRTERKVDNSLICKKHQ